MKIVYDDLYDALNEKNLPLKFFALSEAVLVKRKNQSIIRAVIFHRQNQGGKVVVYQIDQPRFVFVEKSEVFALSPAFDGFLLNIPVPKRALADVHYEVPIEKMLEKDPMIFELFQTLRKNKRIESMVKVDEMFGGVVVNRIKALHIIVKDKNLLDNLRHVLKYVFNNCYQKYATIDTGAIFTQY